MYMFIVSFRVVNLGRLPVSGTEKGRGGGWAGVGRGIVSDCCAHQTNPVEDMRSVALGAGGLPAEGRHRERRVNRKCGNF